MDDVNDFFKSGGNPGTGQADGSPDTALSARITEALDLKLQIEQETATLEAKQKSLDELTKKILPGMFKERQLSLFKTAGGFVCALQTRAFCKYTGSEEEDAFLTEHDAGGMIKKALTVLDPEEVLLASLREGGIDFELGKTVHASNLKAFANKALGIAAKSVPVCAPSDFPVSMNLFIDEFVKLGK